MIFIRISMICGGSCPFRAILYLYLTHSALHYAYSFGLSAHICFKHLNPGKKILIKINSLKMVFHLILITLKIKERTFIITFFYQFTTFSATLLLMLHNFSHDLLLMTIRSRLNKQTHIGWRNVRNSET